MSTSKGPNSNARKKINEHDTTKCNPFIKKQDHEKHHKEWYRVRKQMMYASMYKWGQKNTFQSTKGTWIHSIHTQSHSRKYGEEMHNPKDAY